MNISHDDNMISTPPRSKDNKHTLYGYTPVIPSRADYGFQVFVVNKKNKKIVSAEPIASPTLVKYSKELRKLARHLNLSNRVLDTAMETLRKIQSEQRRIGRTLNMIRGIRNIHEILIAILYISARIHGHNIEIKEAENILNYYSKENRKLMSIIYKLVEASNAFTDLYKRYKGTLIREMEKPLPEIEKHLQKILNNKNKNGVAKTTLEIYESLAKELPDANKKHLLVISIYIALIIKGYNINFSDVMQTVHGARSNTLRELKKRLLFSHDIAIEIYV